MGSPGRFRLPSFVNFNLLALLRKVSYQFLALWDYNIAYILIANR